jgi:hypothetical protein
MEEQKRQQSAIGGISLILGFYAFIFAMIVLDKFPLAFTTFGATIPGLVLGFIGLKKKYNCVCFASVGIILSLITIALTGLFFISNLNRHGKDYMPFAKRIACTSKLKQIGMALKQYAMDNNNNFPVRDGAKGLDLLRKNGYLTAPEVYICPASNKLPTSGILTQPHISYIYFGGFRDNNKTEADDYQNIPLAFDKPGWHTAPRNKYNIVLFVNGQVENIPSTAKNCKEVVELLHKKYKYTWQHYKILRSKAVKADVAWGLP